MMTPPQFLKSLEGAMNEYRFRDGEALITQIDPTPFTLKEIKAALNLLRRKRQFATMERLASTFFMAGHPHAVIRRQWAQSLLDQNRVGQALVVLREAAEKFASDPDEGPELRGLIGRANKQLYVNEGGAEHLVAAIGAHRADWLARRGDYRWQGINLVALTERARRDSVSGFDPLDPQTTAREILDDIEAKGAGGYWDYATALEASIATGDESAALVYLKDYVLHPKTDAFEIASTLRQLKEVWRADELPVGAKIIPVLEHALLQREGGRIEPTMIKPKKAAAAFEAVYGAQSYTYMGWMDALMRRCLGVARICDRETQAAKGTGFLLPGRVLKEDWGDAPVLLDELARRQPRRSRPGAAAARRGGRGVHTAAGSAASQPGRVAVQFPARGSRRDDHTARAAAVTWIVRVHAVRSEPDQRHGGPAAGVCHRSSEWRRAGSIDV